MHSPVSDKSTTDKLSDTNHEPLAEVQSQINKVSLSNERTEEADASSKPLGQWSKETSSKDDDALDLNSRVRYVRSEVDDKGDRHERPGERTTITNSTSREDSNTPFLLRKSRNKTEKWTDIILRRQDLRRIIYHVMGKHLEHCGHRNWLSHEQTIDEADNELWWYWNELSDAAKSNWSSEQERQDPQHLLDHLSEVKLETVKLVKSISTMTRVPIKDLWCLFRPGSLVISKPYLDEPQLFRVHKCSYYGRAGEKTFVVKVWAFSWTGTELIQEYYNFIIAENQEVTITDLPCYPLQYYRNSDGSEGPEAVKALQADLIARGRVFRDLCRESVNGTQHTYDGELLTDDDTLYNSQHNALYNRRLDIKGDIMIDFTAYKRYSLTGIYAIGSLCPTQMIACKCQLCFDEKNNCTQWMRRFAEEAAGNDSADEANNYLLLPARLLGYCFKTKVWAQFHVNGIGAIETPDADNMMKKLIFPEESKKIKDDLRILIEQHGSTKLPLVTDPIKGKGAGLVVLLHGPPGVGKTLTAETLAKCASKPLYVLGASDLNPSTAETTLMRTFELVERWGAVLLIDEADVFIDSRGTRGEADLSKNALVSVMLRVLEYFKGILIMTTNRVMTFDVAMLSRCHYVVHFKSLTLEQEKEIWKSYLHQLTDQNSSRRPEIEAWVKQVTKRPTKLSGREIRNLLTTAQTLAQAEPSKKIMKKHLESVYDRLMEFLEAMEKNKTTQQALLNASYS